MGYTLSRYFVPGAGELPIAIIANDGGVLDALRAAKSEGAALAAIVPSTDEEFAAYRNLGFADFFMIERTKIRRAALGDAKENIIALPPSRAGECNTMFFEVVRWRGHVMRTDGMWQTAAQHILSIGGGVVTAIRDGDKGEYVAGYAFFHPTVSGVVIDELFCEDEPAFIALQREVLDRCGVDEATLCAPACPHGAERYGMIRALDPAAVIETGLKRRQGDFEIELEDEELGQSARFTFSEGKLKQEGRRGRMAITSGELAAIVLGGGPATYVNMVF